MRILSIETSCDETAIAIVDFRDAKKHRVIYVRSHIVSSQIPLHRKYGGVVPNLARREHERNLTPVLLQALRESNERSYLDKKDVGKIRKEKFVALASLLEREPELLRQFVTQIASLTPPTIDAIAIAVGPGLAPALWTGVNFARALAILWEKPLIPVNHMAGHAYAALLQRREKNAPNKKIAISERSRKLLYTISPVRFPTIALLVSGGHTELVLMQRRERFKIIGETRDDAAGEAFDKVARILNLPYPGGPEISRLAEKSAANDATHLRLPRPMIHANDFDFSFSGLKTAVLYLTRDLGREATQKLRAAIAREFQDAVIDILVKKTIRAALAYKAKTILAGGGVSANARLRDRLETEIKKIIPATRCHFPIKALSGDNALMIALAAFFAGKEKAWTNVHADANMRLGD